MNFSDLFDFNNRVKNDMTLVKDVNGQKVTKQVKGSINWMALIFTGFYAMFSQKYKTKGFLQKALVLFVALIVINLIVRPILGNVIGMIVNLAGAVWYGLMFDTWFKNQLIANGYHVEENGHDERNVAQHDVE